MTRPVFDEIIHAPNRLQICAILATVAEVEFGTLRDTLGVADSVTSKHLKVLQDAGYVRLTKPAGSGRVRTWASLTTAGHGAFSGHLAELHRLAAVATTQGSPTDRPPVPAPSTSPAVRRRPLRIRPTAT